jgi:hypothetical protein
VRGRDGNLIGTGHFKWFDSHFLKGKVLLPEKTGHKPTEDSVWLVEIGKELPNAIFCKAEEQVTLDNLENFVRPHRKAHSLVYQAYNLRKEVFLPIMLDITSEKVIGVSYFENIPYRTTLCLIKPDCKEKLKSRGFQLTESQEKLIEAIIESRFQMNELSAKRKLKILQIIENFKVKREKLLLDTDKYPVLKDVFHYTIQQHWTERNTPCYSVRFFLLEEFLSKIRQQAGNQIPMSINPEDYPLPYRNELEDYICGRRSDFPQTSQAWDALKTFNEKLVDYYFKIPEETINEVVERTSDGLLLTRINDLVIRFKDLKENWEGQPFDVDKLTTKQDYLNRESKALLEEIEETTGLSYKGYYNNDYEIVQGHKIHSFQVNRFVDYYDPRLGLTVCLHQDFPSGHDGLFQVERVQWQDYTGSVSHKYVVVKILENPDQLTPNKHYYAEKNPSLFVRKKGEKFFTRLDHFRTLEGIKGYIDAMVERLPYRYTGKSLSDDNNEVI